MRSRLLTVALAAGALLALAAGAGRARATVGGPELSEALGCDPRTHEVFLRQHHWNEGGYRPTIVRLRPGRGPRLFEPVAWSIGEDEDSTYRARVAALTRRVRRLEERWLETIPDRVIVESADTLRGPGVRVVRWYGVPGRAESIGVVSFRGIPTEEQCEVQVPVVMPGEREELTIPRDWWRGGYPKAAQ